MNTRRMRLLLWLSAACMSGLAVLCLAWGIRPVPQASTGQKAPLTNHSDASAASQPAMTIQDLMQLAQIELRRPLHDPPPPLAVAAPTPKSPPPLTIHLAGTIVEPGHCLAMIQLADGSTQLKTIGDIVGDACIKDIQEGNVTVEYFGQVLQLTVPRDESKDPKTGGG